MTVHTCPDWPLLMELAPDLRFMHCTPREARLPTNAIVHLDGVPLDDIVICCDLTSHVFNPEHTDPRIVEALRGTHWFDLREWRPRPAGITGG
jgi:hypothetical protein